MLPARRSGRTLTLADPSTELEDIYDRMGQLMNFAFGDISPGRLAEMPWVPAADLSENDQAYVMHVEVPGMRKDQLNVQVVERELVITGEITEQSNGRRHRSTRRTGKFEYLALLPGDINSDQVSAELADGVLTVTVPKSRQAKPRQVKVAG
jgi:HSP20 family protein